MILTEEKNMNSADVMIESLQEQEINQFVLLLFESEIGKNYYPKQSILRKSIEKNFQKENMYVLKMNKQIVGVLWFDETGAFHTYPYLHMICVKEEFRKKGIGHVALQFLEQYVLGEGKERKLKSKIFLTVGEWNLEAQKFYEKEGFVKLAEIPNLYRKKVNEILLMKEIKRMW